MNEVHALMDLDHPNVVKLVHRGKQTDNNHKPTTLVKTHDTVNLLC